MQSVLSAADSSFTYSLDYTQVPARLNFKTVTLRVHVGTCVSCSARVDGAPSTAIYLPASQQCQVQVPQGAILEVLAHSVSAAGTGAVTKCTLNDCKKWAYSFTWDDSRASVLPNAMPIFQSYGYRAGMAITTNPMGNSPGSYMTWEDLDVMKAAGWGIFNHSTSHADPGVTAANIATYLHPVRTLIEDRYPGYYNTHLVYPFNYVNFWASVRDAGYFYTAEGETGFNYVDAWPPQTVPAASNTGFGATDNDSVWLLRRYQAYRDTPVATWNSWLDNGHNQARPAWVIAFSHQCIASPGFYDSTPTQLNTHLSYLYNTYGVGGNNSVWVAPTDEVAAYVVTRERIIISPIAPVTPSRTPTLSPSFTVSPTFTPSPTLTPTPCGEVALHRVNSGGSAYTDGLGQAWSADQAWSPGAWGFVGGSADSAAVPIAGSTDDPLYQSERWGTPLEYRFSVPNGDYRLRLHFAEIYFTANAQRVFNVSLEGVPAVSNLDIHAQAGANTALVLERDVTVNDGVLNLTAQASADAAKFSALEVIRLLPCASPSPTATRSPTLTQTRTASPTPTPTASSTWTSTPSPTPTLTASLTVSRSATPAQTQTASPTLSPSSSPTLSGTVSSTASPTSAPLTATPTPSVTPLASSTAAPSLTATHTVTPPPSSTASPSLTSPPDGTPLPSSTATPTLTSTLTVSPLLTSTATPSLTSTRTEPSLAPATVPPSGPVSVLNAIPMPNPNPRRLAFELDGSAERMELRLYSRAYVLLETQVLEGPWQAGWNQASLGPAGLQGLANGVVYAVLLPQPGGPEGQGRVKIFIYR